MKTSENLVEILQAKSKGSILIKQSLELFKTTDISNAELEEILSLPTIVRDKNAHFKAKHFRGMVYYYIGLFYEICKRNNINYSLYSDYDAGHYMNRSIEYNYHLAKVFTPYRK